MKRYNSYKPTSMQWLKEIPSHWEVCLLGSLAKLKTGGTPSFYLKEVEEDSVDWFTPSDFTDSFDLKKAGRKLNKRDFEEAGIAYFPPNSILIIGIGGTAGKVSYNSIPCYSNQQITAIIPYRDVNSVFCTMYIRSLRDFLLKTAPYTTLPILNNTFLSSIKVVLPPLAEQEKIVSYLEDKTSKIDAYVADKEKEIELLQELKQETIADAVTKGLNPDAKMKDSGISWIGEIPEHWEVKQLRSFLSLFTEKGHGDAQLLSVTREQGVILRDKDNKEENHNFVPEDLSGYKYIEKGDFAINKMKAWQGSYAVSDYCGIVSPAYFTCKLKGVNKDFFSRAIRSKAYIPFFTQYSKGIRVDQWDLNPNALKSIPFLLPPVDEQQAIVSYIEEKCEKIDKLASKLQSEIGHLKEYKQRLIADCVTGQINVQDL